MLSVVRCTSGNPIACNFKDTANAGPALPTELSPFSCIDGGHISIMLVIFILLNTEEAAGKDCKLFQHFEGAGLSEGIFTSAM